MAALLEPADAESVLHDEFSSYDRAAKGIHQRPRAAAADPALLPDREP
ncbi:hypothetical protein ACIOD0_24865 [Kitasatospora albolonga]